MILDRDTNKCYYYDITKYLDKYRNKHSLTSTKASASINTKYDKYILLPLLWVQFPRRPNAAPPLASTPPQHSPHTVPTHLYPSATQPPPRICTPPTRRPDVAPTQLYAAPTSLQCRSHTTLTPRRPPRHCTMLYAATTPLRHVAQTSPLRRCTPARRPPTPPRAAVRRTDAPPPSPTRCCMPA